MKVNYAAIGIAAPFFMIAQAGYAQQADIAVGTESTSAPSAALVQPTPQYDVLPANTELTITPNDELTSKKLKQGDTFMFSTVYDVLMHDQVIIPKGSRGQGRVTWRTGKGAFGKSAKMDLAFEWIDVNGRRIAIEGTHRQEGKGNTGATVGAVVAAGVFGAFVTGKSATIPHGMQLRAFTAEPIRFIVNNTTTQAGVAVVPANGSGVRQGTSPALSYSPSASGN